MLRTLIVSFFIVCSLSLYGTGNDLLIRSTIVPVGTHGAVAEFPTGWGRGTLEASFGNDQFMRPDPGVYLVFVQLPGFLSTEEVLDARLKLQVDGWVVEGKRPVTEKLPNVRGAGTLFTHVKADVRFSGLDLTYMIGVVGLANTKFSVLAWSLRRNQANLLREVESIVSTLRWDEESEVYKAFMESKEVVSTGSDDVSVLRYPKTLFEKSVARNSRFSLSNRDEDVSVAMSSLSGPWAAEASAEKGALTLKKRSYPYAYTKNGDHGRLSVDLRPGADPGLELAVTGNWGRETLQQAALLLLEGLTVNEGSFQQALPAKKPEQSLSQKAFQALRARSVYEGRLPESPDVVFRGPKGLYYAVGNGYGLLAHGSFTYEGRWEKHTFDGAALVGGTAYFEDDGHVFQYQGELKELPWRGRLISGDPSLHLLRSRGRPELSVPFFPTGGLDEVVERSPDGRESVLTTVPGVKSAASGSEGLLLAVGDSSELLLVSGGRTKSLGQRTGLRSIRAAESGWLVKDDQGLSWLNAGKSTPLFSEWSFDVFDVRGGRVWFLVDNQWDTSLPGWQERSVFSAPLADFAAFRDAIPSLGSAVWNAAGRATGLDTGYPPLPSAASVMALAQKVGPLVLPMKTERLRDPEFLDTLVEEGVRELTGAGMRAQVILMGAALLETGAEWVPTDHPEVFQPHQAKESLYSAAYSLPEVLYDGWYSEDGVYMPVQNMLEDRDGRPLLVGLSSTELRVRQQELDETDPLKLPRSELKAWLEQPQRKGNLALREHVLEQLWFLGETETLNAVLSSQRAGDQLFAYLLAWLEHGLGDAAAFQAVFGARPDDAIPLLKSLVTETDSPMATYFLGKAWEFSDFAYGTYNARQCFQDLGDSYRTGKGLKELVRSELARLGGDEDADED